MICKVRDAVLDGDAAEMVFERKKQFEKENNCNPKNRGIVVNGLLKELVVLKKQHQNLLKHVKYISESNFLRLEINIDINYEPMACSITPKGDKAEVNFAYDK